MKEQYNINNLVEQPYGHYLPQYQNRNPELISSKLGFPYSEVTESFQVRFMGNLYSVTWPDFQITAQDTGKKIYTLAEDIHAQILFSDNFALAFSPEDVAYVVDVILDYMKEYEKVMFKN